MSLRSPARCVIKLGGSLLSRDDFPALLPEVLTLVEDRSPLVVLGGGAAADVVREWDRRFCLGDETAHWIALAALDMTRALLLQQIPRGVSVANAEQLSAAREQDRIPVLDAGAFLRDRERQPGAQLPHVWEVTTDSIAAWAAIHFRAEQLWLVKSVGLPEECSPARAAEQNLVDPYFCRLAERLGAVWWVDASRSPLCARRWL